MTMQKNNDLRLFGEGNMNEIIFLKGLPKIQEMKSIPNPRLWIEIFTIFLNMSSEEYRKKPLFSPKNFCLPIEFISFTYLYLTELIDS